MNANRSLVIGLLVTALTALEGCADPIHAEVKPCPCADGYVCCSTGVCTKEGQSCDETSTTLFKLAQGEWEGYLESFPGSGLDAIRLSVALSRDGVPSATLLFGQAAPLPPVQPTDVFWPPMEVTFFAVPLDGVSYTATNLRWEHNRMRFSIDPLEPWQPFCALQPSYPVAWAFTGYQCDPARVDRNSSTECYFVGSNEPADCRRASLCDGQNGACECTATECFTHDWGSYAFDIALHDDIGDGSTTLGGSTNLRLERR